MLARLPVKAPGLLLRAEVLEQAGRLGEARADFEAVLRGEEDRGKHPETEILKRAREGLDRVRAKSLKNKAV